MRVTAGELRGRRINVPRGDATRPTSERVREALFSILGPPPTGCAVLDLFAGAGTLAIEALSRGAASAVLVESGRAAASCARANLRALGLSGAAEVWQRPAAEALRRLAAAGRRFDWAFVDPPYASDHGAASLEAVGGGELIAPGGVLVLEHDRRRPPAPGVGCLVRTDVRRYGDTELSFFRITPP